MYLADQRWVEWRERIEGVAGDLYDVRFRQTIWEIVSASELLM
jgi:hypothetical protein